jgi:hypothetical protein
MKIYAELPAVRLRQLIADGLMLAWGALGIWLVVWLRERASGLAEPGRKLESTGGDLGERFADAGDTARKAPGVGRSLAAPFEAGVDAADALARAGRGYQDLVQDAANVITALVVVVTLFGILLLWLPPRAWWIRRATAVARLRDEPAGRDLLALRALASRPLRRLRRAGADPAGGWRRGDPETIAALVALELRAAGLRQRRLA